MWHRPLCRHRNWPDDDGFRIHHETWMDTSPNECTMKPWNPLWLDAPPWSPDVTPKMRRESKRAATATAPPPYCPGCLGVDGCGC
jgi:hypothetical protein